jgi:poly(hydroxyalkanoate) depolymerase family esterase
MAAGLLVAPAASAASLQQVNGWSTSSVPSDVSMYIYVPDKVVTNAPILVVIHYCGGTASAVFGQAQGGGIVKASDQNGFIMVFPSSGRCWDVVSDKARKRDGGGDSDAIRQMVKYAVDHKGGNADRVYSTGDSSGGMMTELLLAVYPDVFKAGAAFAGMPAGCRGSNESGSGGGYSGACAGGSVTHTAQEWGDLARSMDPGYTGHRPRVQLFHGDADGTINYKNFTEAIKEWTNVLGLQTNPSSTTSVTLGMHQGSRQTWQSTCPYPVLDGFTSMGGDHGPSDALFLSQYVIPFLGLDKAGAVDPEVQQCSGTGGMGAGGMGAGGASGHAGAAGGPTGSGGASGATSNTGGAGAGGGGNGGVFGNGGAFGSGGATFGGRSNGGAPSGGAPASAGTGANIGAGGTVVTGTGGTSSATGGSTTNGGSPAHVAGTGGTTSMSPQAGSSGEPGGDDSTSGCGCKLDGGETKSPLGTVVLGLGIALATFVRRRSGAAAKRT